MQKVACSGHTYVGHQYHAFCLQWYSSLVSGSLHQTCHYRSIHYTVAILLQLYHRRAAGYHALKLTGIMLSAVKLNRQEKILNGNTSVRLLMLEML